MKLSLKEARNYYYEASGTVSSISRQLGFAGIAIIWLFRNEAPNKLTIPEGLSFSIVAILCFFIFDLCQYISQTILWGIFQRKKEKDILERQKPDEFLAPDWFPTIALIFFAFKLVSIFLAYISILLFLLTRIEFL